MLQLLGLLLKAIITIAIGMMGFTWEPKEDVRVPEKKEKHGEFILPVYLHAPVGTPVIIEAKTTGLDTNCADAPHDTVFSLTTAKPQKPGLAI